MGSPKHIKAKAAESFISHYLHLLLHLKFCKRILGLGLELVLVLSMHEVVIVVDEQSMLLLITFTSVDDCRDVALDHPLQVLVLNIEI